MNFTEKERMVLGIAQENIPDTLTPFADMAAEAGMEESELLEFLRNLKESGAIRRFGASIRHRKTGWTHNAMVAWKVEEKNVEEAGATAAENPRISHCYYRPSPYPEWPYRFYTMIHGKSVEECLAVVEELKREAPLGEYEILESIRELKKISMTYFPKEGRR